MGSVRVRVALIIIKEDKVLLIKQRKKSKEYWLVPGGGVDFGETIGQSAKREFVEETGLNVDIKDFLFSCETIGGNNRHIIHLFFKGEIISGDLKLGEEENLVDLKFIDIDEFENITIYPNVKEKIIDSIKNNTFVPCHIHGNIWED